jgi:hypothetical protein
MTHLTCCGACPLTQNAGEKNRLPGRVAAHHDDQFQTHVSKHAFAPRDAMRPSRAFIFRPDEGVGNCRVNWRASRSCPGRGATSFTLLRRAGTHSDSSRVDPGSAAHRCALRCVRGTLWHPPEVYQTCLMKEMPRDHIPLVSRTRRSVLHAAPQSRDPCRIKHCVTCHFTPRWRITIRPTDLQMHRSRLRGEPA